MRLDIDAHHAPQGERNGSQGQQRHRAERRHSVVVIKDLKVKGSSIPLKRGTVIRNIRLIEDDDDENIEGNSDKIKGLVLKACFLKKA